MKPAVSVLLPVYNAKAFLRQAIDSILTQTFTDFEFIIINDGSTDGSEAIIQSYTDERILLVNNNGNQGLIFTLNRGIEMAQGRFIARMDADDVALPERLERQVAYLENSDVAFLATRVKLIDVNGDSLPDWPDDAQNVSAKAIKRFLLKDNCIAHPSVIGRTKSFKKYQYKTNQKYSEDYDLWLRAIADGLTIEKLPEPLLLHRILPNSATRFKRVNIFFRLAKVKFRFLTAQPIVKQLGAYQRSLCLHACIDLLKAGGKELKSLFAK